MRFIEDSNCTGTVFMMNAKEAEEFISLIMPGVMKVIREEADKLDA